MQCFSMIAATTALIFTPAVWAQSDFLEQETQDDVVSTVGKGRLNGVTLNSRTFGGNVLRKEPYAEHWMVLFCYSWYPPCQAFQVPYMAMAENYSKALNNDTLFSNFIRFAAVDCAVDKVLCNEQQVEQYPTVSHYTAGELRSQWTGSDVEKDAKRVRKWLNQEIAAAKARSLQQKPPLFTEEERRLALRILFAFAACVSSFVWAVGRGADLWLLLRARQSSKPRASAKKEEQPQPTESSLASRLPEEWASGRGSLEL